MKNLAACPHKVHRRCTRFVILYLRLRGRGRKLTRRAAASRLLQVATAICLDPSVDGSRKKFYLSSSFLTVMVQTVAIVAVMASVRRPSCLTNNDCPAGDYCVRLYGQCLTCEPPDSERPDVPPDWFGPHDTPAVRFTNNLNASEYCAPGALAQLSAIADGSTCLKKSAHLCAELFDDQAVLGCEACFDRELTTEQGSDGWNTVRSERSQAADAVGLMQAGDYATLVLVSYVVGLNIAVEVRDIKMCALHVQQRCAASTGHDTLATLPSSITRALMLLNLVRQFGFLPQIACTVAILVLHRGSTALEM